MTSAETCRTGPTAHGQRPPGAIAIAAGVFLDIFNLFLLLLDLSGGSRESRARL